MVAAAALSGADAATAVHESLQYKMVLHASFLLSMKLERAFLLAIK